MVRWLGPKVGSRLALFCIHRVNRMNSRNDSVSRYQHHKHFPCIIIIIIIIIPRTWSREFKNYVRKLIWNDFLLIT